jgi:hypothetical protein
MKCSMLLCTTGLVAAVYAGVVAIAADARKPSPAPTPKFGQPLAGGSTAVPLKGEMRLVGMKPIVGRAPEVTLELLQQKFTSFSSVAGQYRNYAALMPGIANQCAAKAYSVQDQTAAGCSNNDTVKQCMDKLYKHCIKTYQPAGQPDPPYKQAHFYVSYAVPHARQLSQLLGKYATETEQSAEALLPPCVEGNC